MKPYKEKKISDRVFERIFEASDKDNFIWHRDKENRKIIVMAVDTGWKFQLDNCLPIELFSGMIISVPKETFHRIISGTGQLKVRLVKDFD